MTTQTIPTTQAHAHLHDYTAYTLDELCTLATSYCNRLEVWGLDAESRDEFDRMLAELDQRGKL
jgi:hypothetical protein